MGSLCCLQIASIYSQLEARHWLTAQRDLAMQFSVMSSVEQDCCLKFHPAETGLGVQVMADAADACCLTIIQHCISPRLMSRVCEVVKADKNAKLRQHCAAYLLQASL